MDFSFEKDIVLENDRVRICPILLSDIDNLLKVATSDPSLVQYSPFNINSEPLLRQYIEKALSDRASKVRYAFILFDKKTNEYAGSTSFGNLSNADKRVEIGWTWIGKPFQKTGLNRNCKHLLMNYVFETLGFERLELRTDERNAQSRKAIEAIGGKFEGILRSHMIMTDGFRRSTVCYSILKNEWPVVKEKLGKSL
jgi:RimJ/RimL family protein N-acetyltransferase